MNTVRRRLIRIRGSYALYLPKVFLARYGDVSDVEVLWDHNSLVVVVPTRKRAATRWSERADKVVVGAYAAGLDELVLLDAPRDAAYRLDEIKELIDSSITTYNTFIKVLYYDIIINRVILIDFMYKSLRLMLDALANGLADRKTIAALDRELDKQWLRVSRSCVRRPSELCAFHVPLARYYERAGDHLVALSLEKAPRRLFAQLSHIAEEYAEATSGGSEKILLFIKRLSAHRHATAEIAETEIQKLHALRFIDYLENAAEIRLNERLLRDSEIADDGVAAMPGYIDGVVGSSLQEP